VIYTRFGSPVTIECDQGDTPDGRAIDVRREDGSVLHTYLYELRADGGIEEVLSAIKAAGAAEADAAADHRADAREQEARYGWSS
jgi:hypothetical protein